MSDDLTLGRLLGRREAFQLVAARCSAAEATAMRDIRERKLYIGHAADWGEFCQTHLNTSKQNANRIIHVLEEFGPSYFEVAQYTRISPTVYRAIAPVVEDHNLQHNGESIALVPENAGKVHAAITELRKKVRPEPVAKPEPAPPPDPIPALDRHCSELLDEIKSLIAQRQHERRIQASIGYLKSQLDRIELTI